DPGQSRAAHRAEGEPRRPVRAGRARRALPRRPRPRRRAARPGRAGPDHGGPARQGLPRAVLAVRGDAMSTIHAVLAGVDRYAAPGLPDLAGCGNDITAVRAMLERTATPGTTVDILELRDEQAT